MGTPEETYEDTIGGGGRGAHDDSKPEGRGRGEEGLTLDGAQGLASKPDDWRELGNSGASSMSSAGQILSRTRHSRCSIAARKQHTACPNIPTLRYAC